MSAPPTAIYTHGAGLSDSDITEGKKKRRVNILGDLVLFIRMYF